MGSNVSFSSFLVDEPKIDQILLNEIQGKKRKEKKIRSVSQWLENKKVFYPSNRQEILEYLKKREIPENIYLAQLISVYLDLPEIYNADPSLFPLFLNARNPNWNRFFNFEEKYFPTNIYLIKGMKAAFSEGCISILKKLPSYFDFCFWIFTYRTYYITKNLFYIEECQNIFKAAIENGYILDNYTLDEIGSIDMKFRKTCLSLYSKPYWKKICSQKLDKIPTSLYKDLICLGISEDFPPNMLCQKLTQITDADPEALKTAISNRQKQKIILDKYNIVNFINPEKQDIYIFNRNNFQDDPLLYADHCIAYYTDFENRTWIYLSNSFENILETKINKTSGLPFPKKFIFAVQSKVKFIEEFKFSLSNPINLLNCVISLNEDDKITNTKTDFIIGTVLGVASLNGLNKDVMLNGLTIKDYEGRISDIGFSLYKIVPNIKKLMGKTLTEAFGPSTANYIFAVLCRFLYIEFKKNPQNAKNFFGN